MAMRVRADIRVGSGMWHFVLIVCMACLGVRLHVHAQTVEGSIRGVIRDAQGAVLPGVTVNATSALTPIEQSATTDSTGTYRLLSLPPGTYTVTLELTGFRKMMRENVIVRAGVNLALDVSMLVADVNEAVVVRADSPMVETRTAATTTNVSGSFQRELPLSTRHNWYDFLRVIPSTVSSDSTQVGSFSVNGADITSHVVQVDGADIAAGVQSSMSYLFGSSGIIQDVQIKTSGSDAAAPLGQGAVISVVTQSGSDKMSGNGEFLYKNRDWNGNNLPNGTTTASDLVQPEINIGGPLRRHKSWLFGSYRHARLVTGISRTATQLANDQLLIPNFTPFDTPTTSEQSFIKSTTQLSAGQRLQVFHQYGIDKRDLGGASEEAVYFRYNIGGHAASGSLESVWGPHLTSRLVMSFNNQSNPLALTVQNQPGRPIHRSVFLSNGVLQGSGALATIDNTQFATGQNAPATKFTVSFDMSYYHSGRFGTHDVQVGTYIQPKRLYSFTNLYPNNGFNLEEQVLRDPNNPAAGWVPFHRTIYDVTQFQTANVNSEDYAGYVQDSWKPSERLTVTAGVRIDKIKRRDRLFDVVVQDTTAIGPRLGLNYRLTSDSRNIARISFNRIHDAVSVGSGTTAGSASAGKTDLYDTDLDGTFETKIVTPAVTARTVNGVIDLNGYRQPHVNEFAAGYTRQLPGQITADVGVVYREYRDRPASIDVNSIYANNLFVGFVNPNVNQLYKLTSNVYNWPVYTGLSLQVAKNTSRVQLLGSYAREFRHLEGTWQPNDPASFLQPDAFANDHGIGMVTARTQNSLSGTDMANTSQWRDHVVRLMGSVQLPASFVASAAFTFQSGPWSGPIVTRLAAPDPLYGPGLITLPTGRVFQNPLATPIRFAYPSRGDGQFRLPSVKDLSVRVGRDFRVAGWRLSPSIEVLNLTNNGSPYEFQSGANQQYNTTAFQQGTGYQPPRSAQLSIRALF